MKVGAGFVLFPCVGSWCVCFCCREMCARKEVGFRWKGSGGKDGPTWWFFIG